MNIFLDTNIYLNFYHLSNENLEELRKLFVLIKTKKIKLFITDQVLDEFKRNRDTKILDALKRFRKDNFNQEIPQMVMGYEEYTELKKAVDDFTKSKSVIIEKMTKDIMTQSLKADLVINEIFSRAERLEFNDEIYQRAKIRHARGNPPGKKDSLGDAINWENLLAGVPTPPSEWDFESSDNDLHIISLDGDWFTELDENLPKRFLSDEWQEKAASSLFVYQRISLFTSQFFPKIKLATDLEKHIAIQNLANSGSYSTTHAAIRLLSRLIDVAEFTESEVNEIINAYITNSQVYWILGDEDVIAFVLKLIDSHYKVINNDSLETLVDMMPDEVESEEINDKIQELKKSFESLDSSTFI